ncbi:unnamed protein product [Trichobilharzia regenti]|nr:unnamed protein product [Trichobilharzia regenti]
MLNRDKKNAKDEAKKEKKKKMQKEISLEANDDDAAIEVIPERPATPKLVETVVKSNKSRNKYPSINTVSVLQSNTQVRMYAMTGHSDEISGLSELQARGDSD